MNLKIGNLADRYVSSLGEGVTVAVIDSGVEAAHPGLAGVPIGGVVLEERFGRVTIRDFDGVDVAGHGTACAGLIVGVAPRVKILSCRVLNRNIRATSLALLAALDWVCSQTEVGVVNLSLGTTNKEFGLAIAQRVDALYARGVPVVAARGFGIQPDFPSAFGSPVSVAGEDLGGIDRLRLRPDDVVEFGAQAFGLDALWRGGGRVIVNGSSFAAPLVAGRLARFKSLDPSLRVYELKTLLAHQAREMDAAE